MSAANHSGIPAVKENQAPLLYTEVFNSCSGPKGKNLNM
jgi:hypothetical protein